MAVFAVIGVPRSGTSLTAGILHKLGVPMGQRWTPMPESWHPPDGTFCDQEFNEIHHRLLGARPMRHGQDVEAHFLDEYRALIRRRVELPSWGLKCHLLPFVWGHFLDGCTSKVRLVKTWRCPDESIKSYAARSAWTYAKSREELEPWYSALAAIWEGFAGPKLEVRFADLVNDPAGQVQRIAAFAEVPATQEAIALVKPDWKRF